MCIRDRSYAILDEVASVMAEYPNLKVRVEGHTDSQGNDQRNQELSQTRADAVMAYLIEKGVSPTRLSAVGFGESAPVADNGTREGRAQNRRVQFTASY